MRRRRLAGAVTCAWVLAAASGPVAHAQEQPYRQNDAGGFRNVLPGGQGETVNALELAAAQGGSAPASYTDQLPMYTELLKAEPTLTAADLDKFFKDTSFGAKPEDVVRTARPRAGVAILRDRYNVPHVYGQTRADTMFGAGYASAEDRLFLMDVLRHTGRGRLTELIGAGTNDANVVAARPGRPGQGDGERRDDRRPRSGGLPAAAARDRPDAARRRRAAPEDVDSWRGGGAHRRDLDGDNVYDEGPAVALMDAWWPRLLEASFKPVVGQRFMDETRKINPFISGPGPGGSAFGSGWWGYVDKDLRKLLGQRVRGPLSRGYCGRGRLTRCRSILVSTLRDAAIEVRGKYRVSNVDDVKVPATCKEGATPQECDQIEFTTAGAVSTPPIPWQDRPTFQQIVAVEGRR